MSLYTTLIEAGVECGNWQSDLYFPANETTQKILADFPKEKAIAKTFKSEIDGQRNYEVPFAFDPYWEKKFSPVVDS
jgi:hypothetical protein